MAQIFKAGVLKTTVCFEFDRGSSGNRVFQRHDMVFKEVGRALLEPEWTAVEVVVGRLVGNVGHRAFTARKQHVCAEVPAARLETRFRWVRDEQDDVVRRKWQLQERLA